MALMIISSIRSCLMPVVSEIRAKETTRSFFGSPKTSSEKAIILILSSRTWRLLFSTGWVSGPYEALDVCVEALHVVVEPVHVSAVVGLHELVEEGVRGVRPQ